MPQELETYDSKKVLLIVGGSYITGFQDGTNISVDRNADSWNFSPNVGGGGTRSKTNNTSGRITFTLSQTSSSNFILSTIQQLDEKSNAGLVPVLIEDLNGRSIHSCESAWVVKPPAAEYGMESSGRQWILETDNLNHFSGGN
jgi:hypothetical protein